MVHVDFELEAYWLIIICAVFSLTVAITISALVIMADRINNPTVSNWSDSWSESDYHDWQHNNPPAPGDDYDGSYNGMDRYN